MRVIVIPGHGCYNSKNSSRQPREGNRFLLSVERDRGSGVFEFLTQFDPLMTEWKQGGYNDWLRHQEARAWVRRLVDESANLEEEAGDVSVADWLSAPVAIVIGRWILETEAGEKNDPTQRAALLAAMRELTELRRCDHRAERLRIDRERWETEQQERQKKELEELRRKTEATEACMRFLQADAKMSV